MVLNLKNNMNNVMSSSKITAYYSILIAALVVRGYEEEALQGRAVNDADVLREQLRSLLLKGALHSFLQARVALGGVEVAPFALKAGDGHEAQHRGRGKACPTQALL